MPVIIIKDESPWDSDGDPPPIEFESTTAVSLFIHKPTVFILIRVPP